MPHVQKTNAEKREQYLSAAICIAMAGFSIVSAEDCDEIDEMPDGEPKEIAEFIWKLLEVVSERTGSVMPKNDAAESLHWCLVVTGGLARVRCQ